MMADGTTSNNPLLDDALWSLQPYQMPPFAAIQPHHFSGAFRVSMQQHRDEIDAIASCPDDPSFDNTISAYDRAGSSFRRIHAVFSNLCLSQNGPDLQKVESEWAPLLSRHESSCYQNDRLFARIQAVYDSSISSSFDLTSEQVRLVERLYLDFTRQGGAHLSSDDQTTLANLQADLAALQTTFSQQCLQSETEYQLVVTRDDLSGCPESLVESARAAAAERGHADPNVHVLTLGRSTVEPFLTFSDRRDLRKKLWTAWVERGLAQGNLDVAAQILDKRLQVAKLHGYKNYAEYQCADRMARTPEAAVELMQNVWAKAKVATHREREAMQQHVTEQGWTDEYVPRIEPYDWRYLAEKVRQARYSMDEAQFKPYLSLESVRTAMFAVSNKLFGLTYKKLDDLVLYHPDVEAYEVRELLPDGTDRLVALFVLDSFARPYKKSGAWMSEYRTQSRNYGAGGNNDGDVDSMLGVPIVSNNNNLARGDPVTLLSLDDARTMFHEFGHAHHGMLSNVTYERLASTNVLTDFVELPSQLFEHWFQDRTVLKEYARHYETGEPIPDELLDRWEVARNFQQGFQTVEYTACALLDMELHRLDDYRNLDVGKFEHDFLVRIGMPIGVVMRHRPAHFLHLFASQFYAAGYYVYLWAEVLDKDAFGAFEEVGNVFDRATASRLRQYVYGAGNTEAPDALFRKFRGRDPQIEFMLRHKGLLV